MGELGTSRARGRIAACASIYGDTKTCSVVNGGRGDAVCPDTWRVDVRARWSPVTEVRLGEGARTSITDVSELQGDASVISTETERRGAASGIENGGGVDAIRRARVGVS